MERIDLHLHSNASDGGVSPRELIQQARAGKLDVISLTDHDTARGVRQLDGAHEGLTVIPGIEISCSHEGADVHVLGYFIDAQHPRILEHERYAVHARTARMHGMIEKLAALGVHVRFEEVVAVAGQGAVLGRPHLARVLAERGLVPSVGEAFARYLGDAGPAFVPAQLLPPADGIAIIHDAGGVAVWAHPRLDRVEALIRTFVGWGLDGVECLRPRLQPIDVQTLEGYAQMHALLVTGGSDWHGPWSSRLGEFCVTRRDVGAFLDRGGI